MVNVGGLEIMVASSTVTSVAYAFCTFYESVRCCTDPSVTNQRDTVTYSVNGDDNGNNDEALYHILLSYELLAVHIEMSSDGRTLGELATQLVTESRRSTMTETLFKYNDSLIRTIMREQRGLEELVAEAIDNAPDPTQLPPSVIIHQATISRNKRCLLAYQQHRMNFLKDIFWTMGASLPPLLSDAQLRANLAPHEVDFLREYNAMVVDFRADFADELDISSGITIPPKDIHVTVRVVKDCGVIETETGAIDFQKGQRLVVRRSDIEHLIVQGYLEEVPSG